jgi:hypothetical protein
MKIDYERHVAGAGARIRAQWNYARPPWISLKERYSLASLAMFDLGL